MLTLPKSTASNDKFFSSLKVPIKHYIRSTMGDERALVVSKVKKETNNINLNVTVNTFSKLKNLRYPFI